MSPPRVDKPKRKEPPDWGDSVNKAPKPGDWGSNYSAQEQELAQYGGWDKAMAMLLLNLGTVVKAKARAVKARARLRFLLLAILLLFILVAMLPLLAREADLVPTSVLIVSNRDTTRTRALNWPLRTRDGRQEDGSYWFCSVLQPVHPQRERENVEIFLN